MTINQAFVNVKHDCYFNFGVTSFITHCLQTVNHPIMNALLITFDLIPLAPCPSYKNGYCNAIMYKEIID